MKNKEEMLGIEDILKATEIRLYLGNVIYIVETKIGNAVRVSCTRNGETKNIFWQTNVDNANIGWNNNNVVFINGIRLDFDKGETFDSRSMKSIFNGGLMGWEK